MSLFQKMRDGLYNFVNTEGGFTLHFFSDLIRGASPRSTKQQTGQSQKPLNRSQQKVFDELLKRKQGEPQVAYWKRKKAMLNLTDKESLVQQEIQSRKKQVKQQKKDQSIDEIQEKRRLEMQMKRIKMTRYSSSKQEQQ